MKEDINLAREYPSTDEIPEWAQWCRVYKMSTMLAWKQTRNVQGVTNYSIKVSIKINSYHNDGEEHLKFKIDFMFKR